MLAWSCSIVMELNEEIFLSKHAGRRWTRDWVPVCEYASLPHHICLVCPLPSLFDGLSFVWSVFYLFFCLVCLLRLLSGLVCLLPGLLPGLKCPLPLLLSGLVCLLPGLHFFISGQVLTHSTWQQPHLSSVTTSLSHGCEHFFMFSFLVHSFFTHFCERGVECMMTQNIGYSQSSSFDQTDHPRSPVFSQKGIRKMLPKKALALAVHHDFQR